MFVRTKDGKIFDCYVSEQMGKPIYYPKRSKTNGYIDWNEVYKKSENIIDILEVGDYVNGYYVSKIWKSGEITHYVDEKPIQRKERQITIQAPSYGGIIHLHNEDIKSIVTKEQFESMEYKLGDDK